MAQQWALSIDFGTSNTAAAHTSPAGNGVQTLPLSHDSNLMPSAVFVESPDSIDAGNAAMHRADEYPQAFVTAPKRMLGVGVVSVNGYDIPPVKLVAAPLRAVYTRAVSLHDQIPPARVVLTHPEAWSTSQISVLTDAAALAGIDPSVVTTISEPRAAVYYYTRTSPLVVGARIAVFDFGAGTLDVAVLEATGAGGYTVVAARGDNSLGGKDFDGLIRRWIDQQLGDSEPQLLDWLRGSAPPQVVHTLNEQVRRAKELLSDRPAATIRVPGDGRALTLTLTQEEYNQVIGDQVERALNLTRTVLAEADAGALAALYLTGGSSRTPLIHRRLSELGTVATLDDPKTVVAQGALHAPPSALHHSASTTVRSRGETTVERLESASETTTRNHRWWPIAAAGVVVVAVIAATATMLRPDTTAGEATAAAAITATAAALPPTVTDTSATTPTAAVLTSAIPAPIAGEQTLRGNIVGTFGDPMAIGCTGDVCDLRVTLTSFEINPDECRSVKEDVDTIVVYSTVSTGPAPVDTYFTLTSSNAWSAVDANGSVDSDLGNGSIGSCGDVEISTLMPNSTYNFAAVMGVPNTYDTLIWTPTSHPDLIPAPGLEFSIRTDE